MVAIRDEGGRFDGSIETVWRFVNNPDAHGHAHKSTRNRKAQTVDGTTLMLSMERNWMGKWVKVGTRLTVLPPLGVVSEFVEGPFAGSKMFTVYTPESETSTRVDVFGDFKSPVLRPEDVERGARAWLEEAYNEDAPAIRKLQFGELDASAIGGEIADPAAAQPIAPRTNPTPVTNKTG